MKRFQNKEKFEVSKGVIRNRKSKKDRHDNDLVKDKIYKTQHRKLKTELHEPTKN